ncbi:MAG: ATP-binding protein [Desulfobacula sp.]|jgi:PAS domain S-box-containing protein
MEQPCSKDKIMLVDDDPGSLVILSNILKQDYTLMVVTNGFDALGLAGGDKRPDLILLDIMMPGIDGYEICRQLKTDKACKDIPVIFITGMCGAMDEAIGFKMGAVDYITKPFNVETVEVRIKTHIQLRKTQISLDSQVKKRTRELEKTNEILREEIEQRKEAEKNLTCAKAWNQFLYHNTPVMMQSIDTNGRLISVNDHWLKKLGYQREAVVGEKFVDFLTPPSWQHAVEKIFPELFEKGGVENMEFQMKKKNEEIIDVLFSAILEKDDGKREHFLSFAVDITQMKQSEREKNNLKTQLWQAQKMEAIGYLAAGITHDFNNILFVILGLTQLAMDSADMGNGNDMKKELDEIMKACHRAAELTNYILTFSRKTDIQKMPLPVAPLLKETIKFIRASLPRTIRIEQKIQVSEGMIKADPTQIIQIIMNLCTNAVHAMKKQGGVLEISLDELHIRETIDTKEHEVVFGKYYRLVVQDTGHGIPIAIMDKIFDPFFTTKKQGEGTGLGLSMVNDIIKDINGSIQISSEPEKGTRVEILLPGIDSNGEDGLVR